MNGTDRALRYINIGGICVLVVLLTYLIFTSAGSDRINPVSSSKQKRQHHSSKSKGTSPKSNDNSKNRPEKKGKNESTSSDTDKQTGDQTPDVSTETLSVSEIETLANDQNFRNKVKRLIEQGKLKETLKQYDEYLVWRQLNRWTGISQDQFPGEVGVHRLAARLVESSMTHLPTSKRPIPSKRRFWRIPRFN